MKLTAVLLLACCLQVANATTAQKVTLSKDKVSLKNVFAEIKRQTGYAFFYNARLLENAGNVNIDVKNAPLEEVLELCFKDQPLTYHIVNKTIVVSVKEAKETSFLVPEAAPPTIEVTGKLIDGVNNAPIEGASITVKGVKKGTISDKTGFFKIIVEPGTTLVISFVGYEDKEVKVTESKALSLKLTPKEKDPLQQIVITGFQKINKESYTGSTVTVSGDDLKKVNPQNILRSLQVFDPSFRVAENNLAGSNPNGLPNISVRGTTSFPAGANSTVSRSTLSGSINLPTFMLDGYEVSLQKIYDLDANRIESITILKDAAATAIYGSRAANGVIVITTKQPKSGELHVSYNYELRVNAPDLSQYHVLDAAQKLDYEKLAGLYTAGDRIAYPQEELDKMYYKRKEEIVGGINTYWLSQPLRTALGHKHSIYIDGGEGAVRYGLGLRYETLPGVMKGSTRNRYSTDITLSYAPSSRFLFRNTITATQMKAQESPYGNFSDYVRTNPYYPKTDSTGRIIQQIDSWTDRTGNGNGEVNHVALNPMYNSTLGSFDKSEYLEVIDATSIDWTLLQGLRLTGMVSLNYTKSSADRFVSPFANEYFFTTSDKLSERGRYDYATNDETRVEGRISASYNRQIGQHFINTVMGVNAQTYLAKQKGVTAIGFTNDRFTDISFANSYAKNSTPSSNIDRERLMGGFFSVNYAYKNKYLMDFTFREDGSSKFGKDQRVAPFTSFGIGWNLHKEAFLQGSAITLLKLRATTGLTGSVSFDPYMAQTTYSYYTGNWYSTGVGAIVSNFGNDNLQWQKTRSYDAGLELGIHNRLTIIPRYYNKLTHGLVADVSLPPSTGFPSYKENIGDMRNTGFELSINYAAIRTQNFYLTFATSLAKNKNTVVKISNALKSYNDKVDQAQQGNDSLKGAPLLRYNEGQALNTIYAVRSLGIDPENGREIYVKKDGTLTNTWDVKDIMPLANSDPKCEGSFTINSGYKQFNASLIFFTRLGGKQYNQTLVDRVENADPRYNVDSRVFEAKWRKSGDHTFYKNIADLGQTQVSSRFIQNNNSLEMQSVYLSYDMTRKTLGKSGIKTMRFAFTMNDAWRWSSIQQERGIEYPYARSFTLSLQAGF